MAGVFMVPARLDPDIELEPNAQHPYCIFLDPDL
jgi:hypothetical protein